MRNVIKRDVEYSEDALLLAHEAIFDKNIELVIANGDEYKVRKFMPSETRFVKMFGKLYVEQNKKKQTKWSKWAREGHEITWGIRDDKPWTLCFDGDVVPFRSKKEFQPKELVQ